MYYNSLFAAYGSDCQNFASQCIWYGLNGTNTSYAIENTLTPMVPSNYYRKWYQTSALYNASSSWYAVDDFRAYVSNGGPNSYGPEAYINPGISYACVGDIIQYDAAGTGTTYDHSYIVTGVSGTYGSRTKDNITICAHTTDYTSVALTSLYNDNYLYLTIHVIGGSY